MHTIQPPRHICAHCAITPARPNGRTKLGYTRWGKYCNDCHRAHYDVRYKHMREKRSSCDSCGFIAQDLCQLDLVYMDGNTRNRRLANLRTLCANCHRLWIKTNRNRRTVLDITIDADVPLSEL